jgi:cell shape-determining protein MreD
MDLVFALAVAALGIPLAALLVALLLTILRKLPRWATGLIVGACAFMSMAFPMFGSIFGVVAALLGATAASIFLVRFRDAAWSKKVITIVLFAASFAAAVGITVLLAMDGTDKDLLRQRHRFSPHPIRRNEVLFRSRH